MTATTGTSPTAKRGYTEIEAAAYLGISDRLVRQLVADGTLPVRYQGRRRIYDVHDLDTYFESLPSERKPR